MSPCAICDKDLLRACKAARLTYKALERNRKFLVDGLTKQGLPSTWLLQEIEKAAKIEAAISQAERVA